MPLITVRHSIEKKLNRPSDIEPGTLVRGSLTGRIYLKADKELQMLELRTGRVSNNNVDVANYEVLPPGTIVELKQE